MASIESLNAETDANLAVKRTEAATPTPTAGPKPAKVATATKPATAAPRKRVTAAAKRAAEAEAAAKAAAAKQRPGRAARTPRERAALPPTATIAAYVEFLAANVYRDRDGRFAKLSPREREIAANAITLYGAYQSSPERRAARGY